MLKTSIKVALIALAVGGGSLVATLPAMAADSVTVTTTTTSGPVFGYNDGYWDRAHAWHAWENAQAAAAYREANREHYYEYKHDRDPDGGWREKEMYWEQH